MPSMDSGSTAQYIEHLDVLQSIIDKYIVSHRLVVCGDFNGTLMSSRSNQHDRLLRTFCEKNSLTDSLGGSTKCTFFHHSGNSSSQIDYILTKSGCTLDNLVSIFDMQDINTSSHVPVTMSLNQFVSVTLSRKQSKPTKAVMKLKWEKVDKDKFQTTLINSLNSERFETLSVEEKVETLGELLRLAARKSVPALAYKLKGLSRWVSPRVRELLKTCRSTHRSWKYRTDDSNVEVLFAERKLAKKH